MAKKKEYSLDFSQFDDLLEDISKQYGDDELLEIATEVIRKSRNAVQKEVFKAFKESEYSFKKGVKYSQGKARESAYEVWNLPIEVNGKIVEAYAGVDYKKAPEVIIIANGTPDGKITRDRNLDNAIRVKGKVNKEIGALQGKIFFEKLRGINGND